MRPNRGEGFGPRDRCGIDWGKGLAFFSQQGERNTPNNIGQSDEDSAVSWIKIRLCIMSTNSKQRNMCGAKLQGASQGVSPSSRTNAFRLCRNCTDTPGILTPS